MSVRAERLAALARRIPGLVPLVRLGRWTRAWPREQRLRARDRSLLAQLAHSTDLRLNVGSSSSHLDGWVNIDLERDPEGRCLRMDAAKRWPFRDDSAEVVNSEHFIEHLSREQAHVYLREAYRTLRPGGVIRTSTPDLGAIARALVDTNRRDLEVHRSHGYEAATHGEMVNNYVYGSGHRRLYDEETLTRMLEDAGFGEVTRRAFGESGHDILRGIDCHHPEGLEKFVLCLEAIKPRVSTSR
jgi:predicted SAM-dependent methyltransferase